jgi:hypothetical protein
MKKQKPSWQYLRAATRIQTGKRNHSAKLILLFLSDAANDHGQSWHGLRSISAHSNSMSISAVHEALCFLRDDLNILSWKQGSGGPNRKDTNTYTLDLQAMQDLVAAQGVFDAETGKLIYKDDSPDEPQSVPPRGSESLPLSGSTVVSAEASVVSAEASVASAEGGSRFRSAEANPHYPPKINPHKNPSPPSPFFAEVSSVSSVPKINRAIAGTATPIAEPPSGSALNTQFRYGDPLPGLTWCGTRDAYLNPGTGKEPLQTEVDKKIAAYQRTMEMN